MQDSRVIAKIIGPLLVISALGMLLNLKTYQSLIQEFSKSASLCYLGGFLALALGLVILQFNNKWEAEWPVVITILGWISVVKGTILLVFPQLILGLWHPLTGTPTPLIVSSVISLAVGAFLTIKGYWG